MRIALATSHELADLWPGDRLLLNELRRRGYASEPVVWDEAAVDWRAWDAVVIRSCWDYHLEADRFRAWVDRLEKADVPLVNRPDVVRWNMHKGYLLEVQRAGGRIPPTRIVRCGAPESLREAIERTGWRETVIKPAISSTGNSTRLVRGVPTADEEAVFLAALANGDVLLQSYVPEVREHGEWSLVFFDGRFSHAVLKRAAPHEFRVHIEWGGTVERASPPPHLVRDAQRLIHGLDLAAAYARVDAADVNGALRLMELEPAKGP